MVEINQSRAQRREVKRASNSLPVKLMFSYEYHTGHLLYVKEVIEEKQSVRQPSNSRKVHSPMNANSCATGRPIKMLSASGNKRRTVHSNRNT